MSSSPSRRSKPNLAEAISRVCIEMLESRRLLSTAVWTGAGPDTLFSDAANWQGDVVPTSGQNIDFPANPAGLTVTVDSNDTVGNVEFDAAYTLSPPTGLNPTITLDGNLTATSGGTVINNPIVLGQNTTALVYPTANLALNGVISDGGSGFGITQMGTGELTLEGGGDTYTGGTSADGGSVDVQTSLTSAVNVTAYSSFIGNGSINSLSGYGGTYSATGVATPGAVVIANGLSLSSNTGNTMDFAIDGPGASSQFTVNGGTISLGNANLSATLVSASSHGQRCDHPDRQQYRQSRQRHIQ